MTAPARPLCQHERGSCAACCGLYNFTDRSAEAQRRRLDRRTALVGAAWPDTERLAEARDLLLDEERAQRLFDGVKVCPFAGWVEPERVGCLLHPTRHPRGEDLRDLAVYPREVCHSHFCAPHEWLRPTEVELAQTCEGFEYGRVVTDAGVVKAVRALLEEELARPLSSDDVRSARDALASMWRAMLDWPFRDPDPHRFGGFYVIDDHSPERTLPHCLAGLDVEANAATRAVLDGLGTRVGTLQAAHEAMDRLRALIRDAARAIGTTGDRP